MPRREKSAFAGLVDRERWEAFGKWVADQRTTAPYHFTQAKAADAIGISRPHLSQIENGVVAVPRETVIKIAEVIHCPKEVALAQAGYQVKGGSVDERAYLNRILDSLKSDKLGRALEDLFLLYDLINVMKRKKRVFDLGPTGSRIAEAVYLLHELPAWVRDEVLDYFSMVRGAGGAPDVYTSPTRKTEALEKVRSQLRGIEEKIRRGLNVRPPASHRSPVGIGADVYIAVSVKTSGPMPPDYSILSIDACTVRRPEQTFHVEMKPLNSNAVPEVMAANGMDLEELEERGVDPKEATLRFVEWVREVAGFGRPVFVGMTATLDWSFVNWYARKFTGANPFGYGAVDIRTYEMARLRRSWGASTIMEDHGESNFWRGQSGRTAVEQARMFREFFRENTSRF